MIPGVRQASILQVSIAMPRIFISYRRDDSGEIAGRIHERLDSHFGQGTAFIDFDTIPPGVDFPQYLRDALSVCEVLLALMGKKWLSTRRNGKRRLDDPADFVRLEIESALQRNIPVIPILIGKVKMPGKSDLPAELADLAYRNARQVDPGRDFHNHVQRLVHELEDLLQTAPLAPALADAQTRTIPQLRAAPAPLKNKVIDLHPWPPTPAFQGRVEYLRLLDGAWADPHVNVFTLYAWGGAGKTALVGHWIAELARNNYGGAEAVYSYSFEGAAGDAFIEKGLRLFGDPSPTQGTPEEKGKRLAELVGRQRTLLWLDGFQAVQEQEGELGRIKSPALQSLVRTLAQHNTGLCVIGTQLPVADLRDWGETTAPTHELSRLDRQAGADLLKKLDVYGPRQELERAVEEFHGHALSLNLLGTWLRNALNGDIYRRGEFHYLGEGVDPRGHVRRMLEFHERFLAEKNKPALAVLRLVSLFSRPAKPEAIKALLTPPAITNLTDDLVGLREQKWNLLVSYLRELKLLSEPAEGADPKVRAILNAHALVREYFADRLAQEDQAAFAEGHARLSRFFRDFVKHHEPTSSEDMGPLYQAVIHGCQARVYDDVFDNVYWTRIKQGDRHFNTKILHAYSADMEVLQRFFANCWDSLHQPIKPLTQARLLYAVAFNLRALGRLDESLQPMRDCLNAYVEQQQWNEAAQVAGDLSLLHVTLGQLSEAIDPARAGVIYADRGGSAFDRVRALSNLTHALIQGGRTEEALEAFQQADGIVREDSLRTDAPAEQGRPTLQSYWFYDLFLDLGDYDKVRELVELPRSPRTPTGMPKLDKALESLALGRACMGQADQLERTASADPGRRAEVQARLEEALRHLTGALDAMNEANTNHHRPRVLLARAAVYCRLKRLPEAEADLTLAGSIAEYHDMQVHLTDTLIERTRLHLSSGNHQQARDTLRQARKRVDEMDYLRRRPEVEELARLLSAGEG